MLVEKVHWALSAPSDAVTARREVPSSNWPTPRPATTSVRVSLGVGTKRNETSVAPLLVFVGALIPRTGVVQTVIESAARTSKKGNLSSRGSSSELRASEISADITCRHCAWYIAFV
ncbi:hypothetical protein DBV15_04472 [Temnothorax longispinosus]|uniref:Uncharacterized protein n=1 Tax=Temnothorax longispinosus TaxID=300112 RepID=A0A4V3S9U0_9HYME|nr:hypothetical protein DBV15_04472 [Temnothorax longispinosus]